MKKHFLSVLACFAGFFGMVGAASAALPAAIGTELTSVQTDGLALADLVWPVLIALFTPVLLMKLFKRMANKV